MNDKVITLQDTIRHFHLIRAAVRKLHRNHFWFWIKADRMKLDPLPIDETLAQILKCEREAKSSKGLAWLYIDLLGPVFHFLFLALLRRRRLRSELNCELAIKRSLFDFAPGPFVLN